MNKKEIISRHDIAKLLKKKKIYIYKWKILKGTKGKRYREADSDESRYPVGNKGSRGTL